MSSTNEMPDWPENDDRWLTWKSGPEQADPELTTIGEFRSREFGKGIYNDVTNNMPAGATLLPNGAVRLYPDRSVEVHPNGDIFGSYRDLAWYEQQAGLTGSEAGNENPVQAHHLLEDNLMEQFGISRDEGRAVLLDAVDHDHFNEIPRAMPRGARPDDIQTIFNTTAGIYNDANRPEYVDQMRQFLAEHRDRLAQQYQQGMVPGANEPNFADRQAEALSFLNSLSAPTGAPPSTSEPAPPASSAVGSETPPAPAAPAQGLHSPRRHLQR